MSKRSFMVVAAGVAALLVAGGLYASNMGFKLNYPLDSTGVNGSRSGFQALALPYNQQTSLQKASDIRTDVNATIGGSFVSLSKYLKDADALLTYTGASFATDFDLVPGEGYIIQVGAPVNYIIVGSHNPGLVVNLDAAGTNGSQNGFQLWAFPYHGTASLSSELRTEINASSASGNAVVSISKYLRNSDAYQTYTGASFATDFALVPGEAYLIQMGENVAYVPSHY